jgi:hypothetical protein
MSLPAGRTSTPADIRSGSLQVLTGSSEFITVCLAIHLACSEVAFRTSPSLPESVELAIASALDECVPFAWCEVKSAALGITTVANVNRAILVELNLNTVAIREAQGTLFEHCDLQSSLPWVGIAGLIIPRPPFPRRIWRMYFAMSQAPFTG